MATYRDLIMQSLQTAGWEASCRRVQGNRHVATANKAGHTCVVEDGGELGALTKLQQSIRDVEARRLFERGQVIRLAEQIGDIPPGCFAVVSAGGELLTVCQLDEDPESGDLRPSERLHHLPMSQAGKVLRTRINLEAQD